MNISHAHCFFEQSGVFRDSFRELGISAFCYDIRNDFGKTDYKFDLFIEIDRAYNGYESAFDWIGVNDLIFAFFPCTRFEDQAQMLFRGTNYGLKDWDLKMFM